jgi:hypothetical protein
MSHSGSIGRNRGPAPRDRRRAQAQRIRPHRSRHRRDRPRASRQPRPMPRGRPRAAAERRSARAAAVATRDRRANAASQRRRTTARPPEGLCSRTVADPHPDSRVNAAPPGVPLASARIPCRRARRAVIQASLDVPSRGARATAPWGVDPVRDRHGVARRTRAREHRVLRIRTRLRGCLVVVAGRAALAQRPCEFVDGGRGLSVDADVGTARSRDSAVRQGA